jgi:hypothetical protein
VVTGKTDREPQEIIGQEMILPGLIPFNDCKKAVALGNVKVFKEGHFLPENRQFLNRTAGIMLLTFIIYHPKRLPKETTYAGD